MSRVPIRMRLTLAFAAVMALVLASSGLFVYGRLASDLDRTLERELNARVAGVTALVRDEGDDLGDPRDDPLRLADEGAFVQVFDESGAIAGANLPALESEPILSEGEVQRLASGTTASIDRAVPELGRRLRLKAATATDDGQRFTVLVGASLEERDATLESLARLLLLGGPIALLVASLAGYGVAAAALRPVDSMRRHAADISETRLGHRLPLPRSRDEVAALGATLNAMLERLEVASRRERTFSADASHELRTPLSILKVELDLALRQGRSLEELREALQSASVETDRLARLAEDLLVLARADEGRLPVELASTDVDELLSRVRNRFADRAEQADRCIVASDAEGLCVEADPLRVEQAVSNMVDNALRHGGGDVELEAKAIDARVELHVRDRGEGFPAEFVEHAFERFARAGQARSSAGTGLGLSIVAAIATAHGGSAHARNGDDRGADVWLALPQRSSQMTVGAAPEGNTVAA